MGGFADIKYFFTTNGAPFEEERLMGKFKIRDFLLFVLVLTPLSAVQAALGLFEILMFITLGQAAEGTDDIAASIVFLVVIGAVLVGVNKLASLVRFGSYIPLSYYFIDFIVSPIRLITQIVADVFVIGAAVNHVKISTKYKPRVRRDGLISAVCTYLFAYDFSVKTIKGRRRMNKKSYVNNKEKIDTLVSADGEKIEFKEIAGIVYKGRSYAMLQPKKLLDGMSENDALVFRTTVNMDGEDNYDIELNDDVVKAVFDRYNEIVDGSN